MPADPLRKSALYGGPVTEAAVACALEVVELAGDPGFRPTPLCEAARPLPGTCRRPPLTQSERRLDWAGDAVDIVRRIRASDGFPGARTVLAGHDVSVYDARLGVGVGNPGEVIGRHRGHLLVAAGQAAVWIGQLRRAGGVKRPATAVVPGGNVVEPRDGPREVTYRRTGSVGEVSFGFYNGAAGLDQCRRLEAALRYAARQDTQVIVLRSGPEVFCNGIHLGEVEASSDPATAAWTNVRAINRICRAMIEIQHQITITAFNGPAGAGGVMLGLGADVVVGRSGVMLNPYYGMGLYGSELHTLTLPHRVGREGAAVLLSSKLPISTDRAVDIGLVDYVGPATPLGFDAWFEELALRYTDPAAWRGIIYSRLPANRPLDYYESQELAEMARDLYDDRGGFAAARRAFLNRHRGKGATSGLMLTSEPIAYDEYLDSMSLASTWVRASSTAIATP